MIIFFGVLLRAPHKLNNIIIHLRILLHNVQEEKILEITCSYHNKTIPRGRHEATGSVPVLKVSGLRRLGCCCYPPHLFVQQVYFEV